MDAEPKLSRLEMSLKVISAPQTFNNFYKTRMCERNGGKPCPWGTSCNFAHSPEELRPFYDLTKTKMCPTQSSSGTCTKLGCRYAHRISELRSTEMFYKTQLCIDFTSARGCRNGIHCRHAHGEHELRPSPEPLFTIRNPLQFARAHCKVQAAKKTRGGRPSVPLISPGVSGQLAQPGLEEDDGKKKSPTSGPEVSTADSLRKYTGVNTFGLAPPPGFAISPAEHIGNLAALLSSPPSTLLSTSSISPVVPFQPATRTDNQGSAQHEMLEAQLLLEATAIPIPLVVTLRAMALLARLNQGDKRLEGQAVFCKAVVLLSGTIQACLRKLRHDRAAIAARAPVAAAAKGTTPMTVTSPIRCMDGALESDAIMRALMERIGTHEAAAEGCRRFLQGVVGLKADA